VWKDNPDLKLGELTRLQYSGKVSELETLDNKINEDDLELSPKKNTRDDTAREINGYNTRFRSLARGQFGRDSSEYEQTGGTRTSERKPPTRKKKTDRTK
jgi:hypothetical protein